MEIRTFFYYLSSDDLQTIDIMTILIILCIREGTIID